MANPGLSEKSGSFALCANCGARLAGKYCAECGQAASLPGLSFWHLCGEALGELWHLDSKLWRSLLPLLFRPGHLTRAYREGRRAAFLPPLRLYLIFSLLFFVIAALVGNTARESPIGGASQPGIVSLPAEPADNATVAAAETRCDAILKDAESEWLRAWRPRTVRACQSVTADRGRSLQQAAADNIPVMMVVFIPVLALIMLLLYRGSGRYYAEHIVFFLHFHAFGFILLSFYILYYAVGNALDWTGAGLRIAASIITTWLSVYLLLAMRRFYAQGWLKTCAKYLVLYVSYLAGLTISLSAVVFLTALTL